MSEPVLTEKSRIPDREQLQDVLGDSLQYWDQIRDFIKENIGETTEEWKFYSKKYGWTLKTLLKKRNLFFFTPFSGNFAISFVFGDKAVSKIETSDLPDHIISELKNARKYAEGRGIRLEVNREKEVEIVKKLIEIKVRN